MTRLSLALLLLSACGSSGVAHAPMDGGADPDADVTSDAAAHSDADVSGDFMATIRVDTTTPGDAIEGALFGSNLSYGAPDGVTVNSPTFTADTANMGLRYLRWPSGNQADFYDWKTHEEIRGGGRRAMHGGVDIEALLHFAAEVGAKPVVVVNFGSMTPQDAADLVEFLNGPADSEWGSQRAAMGFAEPIGVRHFEVGNEEDQRHMWFYSWTAENAEKYFLGGSEERRGRYDNSTGPSEDHFGQKGDVFRIAADDVPGQTYTLRFQPFRALRVFWTASADDGAAGRFEEWTGVADLATQAADARVFVVDDAAGGVRFGDGVHGARPVDGNYFRVEYTTYGHAGFVDFARAMHAARSSVTVEVGAATLPLADDGSPITDDAGMRTIFEQMDFLVRHQYNGEMPVPEYGVYGNIRQIAIDRVGRLQETSDAMADFGTSIGAARTPALAVTEWNVFLNSSVWHINRTQTGAVSGGEFLVRALAAQPTLPITVATHFALTGGNLALLRTQTNSAMSPLGHVFEGFASWTGSRYLTLNVESPSEVAYNRMVPYVTATGALSEDGATLHVAMVNNAETMTAIAHLELGDFAPTTLRLRQVAGAECTASNEIRADEVTLDDFGEESYRHDVMLPPCSVVFAEVSR